MAPNPGQTGRRLLVAALPSWAMLVAMVLVLGWRLAGWFMRGAFEGATADAIAGPEVALGVAWDLLLVYGVFGLGRSLLLGLAPQRASEAKGSTWLRLALLSPLLLLICAAMTIRSMDAGHCYLAQSHWTADAFLYLNGGMVGLAVAPRGLALGLGAIVAAAGLIWALHRDSTDVLRTCRGESVGSSARLWALLPLLLAVVSVFWVVRDGVVRQPDIYAARLVPETNFALQYLAAREGALCSSNKAYCMDADAMAPLDVPAQRWRHWQKLGLVPATSTPESPFPLLRFGLGEPSLDHLLKPGMEDVRRPNVVMTILESMSGHFVHDVSGYYEGLTPQLDGLAQRMSSVHGFWNNTSPTVNGLVAILCSTHPSRHPSDLGVGEQFDGMAPFDCISESLRNEGYRTMFIGGFEKAITSIEYIALTHGFDEVHGRAEMARRFPHRPRGVWGYHDDALREYAQEQILRLEALRAKDGRPFLLVMMTLDGHEPGMAGETCKLPRGSTWLGKNKVVLEDAASLRQLASVHCVDREIGNLGRFILDQPRARNTMWMITPDHALIRTPAARNVLFDHGYAGAFAPLPLYIYDPRHDLPLRVDVLSASTDVAPTLLHLLGLGKKPTAFMGLSVFGRRRDHPLIVGRMGARMVMMADTKRKSEKPLGKARALCESGGTWLGDDPDPLNACDLMAFFDWLDVLWQQKRILPPAVFKGADGVDVRSVIQRQEPNKAEKRARAARRKAR